MKAKPILIVVLIGAAVLVPLDAQSVGGGISIFVPYDMFEGETGSIAFEQSLSTSLGFGEFLSFPIGFTYAQVYGQSAYGEEGDEDWSSDDPWFYADSFMPYLMAKITLPIGPIYFEAFGGGAANWNISLRPFEDQIADDLRDVGAIGGTGSPAVDALDIDSGLGWGWLAGAGFGVAFGDISVGLSATYRHIIHDLEITGRSFESGSTGTDEFDTTDDGFPIDDLRLIMRGISFGIGGSFNLGGN